MDDKHLRLNNKDEACVAERERKHASVAEEAGRHTHTHTHAALLPLAASSYVNETLSLPYATNISHNLEAALRLYNRYGSHPNEYFAKKGLSEWSHLVALSHLWPNGYCEWAKPSAWPLRIMRLRWRLLETPTIRSVAPS